MKNNNLNTPELIYEKHLHVINGIEFTRREIDVIACLLNGRKTGTIALPLSISPRTVDGYLSSVRKKLGCSSSQSILPLVEKSGKLPLFRMHYLSLLKRDAFEKCLKKLSVQLKKQNLKYVILHWADGDYQEILLTKLKDYLQMIGIEAVLYFIKDQKTFDDLIHSEKLSGTSSLLYVGPEALIPQLKETLEKVSIKLHPLILDKETDYYNFILSTLKELIPTITLTEMFTEFEQHKKNIAEELEKKPKPPSSEKEYSLIKEWVQWFWNLSTHVRYLLIVACLSFLGFCLWALALREERTSVFSSSPTELPIRSELKIPADSGFLDRSEIIKKIEEQLKSEQGIERVALVGVVGIGGAGKTTLARQFGLLQNASVVWEINADKKESLINSFKELSYALAKTKDQKSELEFIQTIQNSEEKEKRLLLLIKNWLREKPNWILIYDNVENLADMKSYFPEDAKVWGKGRVLITTRDKNIENTTYIKTENIIHIEELSDEEKLTLFSKILFNCEPNKLTLTQKEDTINFLKNIPPFPLDISIAAYYIKNNHVSYNQYLEKISENTQNFDKIQSILLKEISNYSKTRYGIITLSLQKMIDINPKFKELLFSICLLDSQNIPKSLLESYAPKDIVNSFIHYLQKESFILGESFKKPEKDKDGFSIHRSTQAIGLAFFLDILKENEKTNLVNKVIFSTKVFYEQNLGKQCSKIIVIIPHLDNILKILKEFKLLREKNEIELNLMLGYSHYNCSSNFIKSKKYFSNIVKINEFKKIMDNTSFSIVLKDLGNINYLLNDFDDTIKNCQKSMRVCKNIKNCEMINIQNLMLIGASYGNENDFEKADQYLNKALFKILNIPTHTNKELKSEIYGQLAALYSKKYLHTKEGHKAAEYAIHALEVAQTLENKEKISCHLSWHKLNLGKIYFRLGKYKEALENLNESQYIFDHKLDNCLFYLFSKARILYALGELFVRKGDLNEADKKLTEALSLLDKTAGSSFGFKMHVGRAEARIRLNKLDKAYEDCLAVFNGIKKSQDNQTNLRYFTAFYHAAIIKYKQNDLQKSAEHFSDFFKQMKEFCKGFLEEKKYKDLESKGVFEEVDPTKTLSKNDIKQYLNRSTQIFSTIYSLEHPFVKDYVMKN